MKKIIIFIFITNFSFAQTGIEIRLVDYNIGRPISNNLSNDVGLNLILEKYGTIIYESKGPHPLYDTLIFQIDCTSLNLNEFVADLQSYSSVVAYVHLADKNLFSDVLRTHIIDANIGIPSGSNDNIITTNDPGLNQIFQNFNVYYYQQLAFQWFTVACNCDNNLLKVALDNYSSVTNKTEYIPRVYLSTSKFNTNQFSTTPNPFSSTFSITTKEFISEYAVFDISGKQIIKTNSKYELDNQALNLTPGVYILKLETENKKVFIQKLIKQ